MNNIFDYWVKGTEKKKKKKNKHLGTYTESSLVGQHSRTLNSRYIFLSVRQGERKSRRGVFLITQIYTEPLPERGERQNSPNKESRVEKQWHANPGPSATPSPRLSTAAICLFSSHRCNPRTKCYPCSLTLISRMQYNREHNLEIARIIPATGLIKACIYAACIYVHVYIYIHIYLYRVFRNNGNRL